MIRSSWQRIESKTVYDGRLHIVEHEAILPNGQTTTYEVEHSENGAVAVLVRKNDSIILTFQYRFPLDKWIYDLPGGGVEPNESFEDAAIRECREEIGIMPISMQELCVFYTNPSRTDWPVHLYFCDNFVESKIETDDASEQVETSSVKVSEFAQRINDGEIIDPSLLLAWYTAREKGLLNVKDVESKLT